MAAVALGVWVAVADVLPGERRVLVWIHADSRVAQVISDLTNLVPLAIVAAGVLIVLLALRRWRDAAYVVIGVGVVWAVNPLLKELVARSRPDLWPLPSASEYSFPAGHAANTAALVGALVMILRSRRVLVAILGAAVLVVVGFSQLVLGRHYPSDVVAGWLWALAWIVVVRNVPKGGPG